MKRVATFLVVFFSLSGMVSHAQDKSDRQIRKEQKKLEQQAKYEQNLELFREWIDSRDFVILTDNITGRYGTAYNLQPTVNFIKVEGDEILIQTAHPFRTGGNGLGGLTTEGHVTSIKVFKDEKDEPISMMINFTTPVLGTANLSVHVNGSGQTSAYLRGNWGRMATFRGEFANSDSSMAYTGMERF